MSKLEKFKKWKKNNAGQIDEAAAVPGGSEKNSTHVYAQIFVDGETVMIPYPVVPVQCCYCKKIVNANGQNMGDAIMRHLSYSHKLKLKKMLKCTKCDVLLSSYFIKRHHCTIKSTQHEMNEKSEQTKQVGEDNSELQPPTLIQLATTHITSLTSRDVENKQLETVTGTATAKNIRPSLSPGPAFKNGNADKAISNEIPAKFVNIRQYGGAKGKKQPPPLTPHSTSQISGLSSCDVDNFQLNSIVSSRFTIENPLLTQGGDATLLASINIETSSPPIVFNLDLHDENAERVENTRNIPGRNSSSETPIQPVVVRAGCPRIQHSNTPEIDNFEHDASSALLAMAINTGLARFSSIYQLYKDSHIIDTDDIDTKEKINRIREEIHRNLPSNARGSIFDSYQHKVNPNANLVACASCGVRAFQMGDVEYQCRLVRDLKSLLLSADQLLNYNSIPLQYRAAVSSYTASNGDIYNLHPALVQEAPNEKSDSDPIAFLCEPCNSKVLLDKIPVNSIASGVDYGSAERIGLPRLSLAEEYLISRGCPLLSIVKLIGFNASDKQRGKKGHIITFPQPQGPTRLAEFEKIFSTETGGVYPNVNNATKFIGVTFVGLKPQWDAFVATRHADRFLVPELQVRPSVVYAWLRALKALNPFYRDIEIDDSPSMTEELNSINDEFSDSATIIDNELDITIDRLVTPNGSTDILDNGNQENQNINGEENDNSECHQLERIPLPASFISTPVISGQGVSATSAFLGLIASLSNDDDDSAPGESQNSEHQNPQQESQHFDRPNLQVQHEAEPFNEFEANDRLLYSSFPFLFILGRGLKTVGSVNLTKTRHMLLQFTGEFSSCFRFIFLLFDQYQRHAATRIVASRVNSDPSGFAAFASWIANPNFISELKEAAANPLADASIKLLKKITPHVDTCTAKIPYSSGERKASMINLYAMVYYYGLPSIFFTFAPDDINGVFNLRMAIPQKDNLNFPATEGAGFAEAILGNIPTYFDIPIDQPSLRILLANGPVAAAETFRLLTNAIFSTLLGTPTEASSKRNVPLHKRKPGVFGVPIATFGCSEEQARGSLHMHALFWGALPPYLLQIAGGVPHLVGAVAKALDKFVCAQLHPITHVEDLIGKFSTEKSNFRPSLVVPHHPIRHPDMFQADVQRAAINTNLHTHSHTCRKPPVGKYKCRVSRPQALVNQTHCVQVTPPDSSSLPDETFKVLSSIEDPHIDSLKGRDVFKVPIPIRDKRSNIWELERPEIKRIKLDDEIENTSTVLNRERHLRLPESTREKFDNLNQRIQRLVNSRLTGRNGLVVEFNDIILVLLGCNSNVSVLGSDSQAKAALCYILKYMTKSTTELTHVLALWHSVRKTIEKYPSKANDAGTELRTAQHFLTRIANQMTSAIEISSMMAAAALLGMPAETTSCSFHFVFVSAALKYVSNHLNSEDLIAEKDEFGERDAQEDEFGERDASEGISESESSDITEDTASIEDALLDTFLNENFDEENEPQVFDSIFNPSQRNADRAANVSSTVYTGATGKIAVPQHVHYAHRGPKLSFYNLYEYSSIITVVPKPKNQRTRNNELDVNDPENTEENVERSTRGRPANGTYLFANTHPLFATHVQRLRSKTAVPVPITPPPNPPSPRPAVLTREWINQARIFSRYILVLFRPWSAAKEEHPGPLTWKSMCDFIRQLENGNSDLDLVRFRWIMNMAHGIRVNSKDRKAVSDHHNRSVTHWNKPDGTAPIGNLQNEPEEAAQNDEADARETEALTVIETIRAETASDDLYNRKDMAKIAFIAQTELSLQAMEPVSNENSGLSISNYDAEQLIHINQEDEPDVEGVLTLLKGDDFLENCAPIEESNDSHPARDETTVHTTNPDMLNFQQRSILHQCLTYLQENMFGNHRSTEQNPLHLIIHGGPGTGKSYLTSCLHDKAKEMDISVACMAFTGIAASNLPNGRTIHSFFSFPINMKSNKYLEPLTTNSLNRLRNQINISTLRVLVIDEISYISPELFGQIDKRMRQIMGVDKPFGGLLVLLMGDFFQLPPVGCYTLCTAVVKLLIEKRCLDTNASTGPRTQGTVLFSKFKLKELTEQMRSAGDETHSEMLRQMRIPENGQTRVDPAYITCLKPIKKSDLRQDKEWNAAPIVVTSNVERMAINQARSKTWSKLQKTPKFVWKIPFTGPRATEISLAVREYIYKEEKEFTGSFVANAPGFLTENLNPIRGLSNGTPVIYHSLILDQEEDEHRLLSLIQDNTGEDIVLHHPPRYVLVRVPNADPTLFHNRTMVLGEVVIPVKTKRSDTKCNIAIPGHGKVEFSYRPHAVDLGFASTAHKIQGQTCNRLILDLNPRPFAPKIDFHSLYVGLSRVRNSQHIRIMPIHPGTKDLRHLYSMNPPETLLTWLNCFDQEGNWKSPSV